jgi:hypothetical protein
MGEYIKTNRMGYTLEDAIERSSKYNAQILKYESGLRKAYIEWNPLTEQMFKPLPDPRYFKKKTVVMKSGEEVLGKELPPDMLTAGINPFIQIIFKIVQRGSITSKEDIVRSLINEERVFQSFDKNTVLIIEGILEYMNKPEEDGGGGYFLLRHHGKMKIGFELPKTYHLVEYRKGYDPFEYHIMRFAEARGIVSRDELYEYIIEYLAWMKSVSKVDTYIDRLVKNGNLRRIQRNFFKFARPLESFK